MVWEKETLHALVERQRDFFHCRSTLPVSRI